MTSGNTDLRGINSEVDSDGLHLGLTAAFSPPELPALGFYFDLGLSNYENDGWRRVGNRTVPGSFDQDVFSTGLGLEYVFRFDQVLLSPHLDLRYTHLKQDAYRETGGPTAQAVDGYNVDSFTSQLGLKLSREVRLEGGTFTPHFNLGWRHEYGDRQAEARSAYLNPGGGLMGSSFNLSGAAVDRDAAVLGAGGKLMFDTASGQQVGLVVDYSFLGSENERSHSIFGGLEFHF